MKKINIKLAVKRIKEYDLLIIVNFILAIPTYVVFMEWRECFKYTLALLLIINTIIYNFFQHDKNRYRCYPFIMMCLVYLVSGVVLRGGYLMIRYEIGDLVYREDAIKIVNTMEYYSLGQEVFQIDEYINLRDEFLKKEKIKESDVLMYIKAVKSLDDTGSLKYMFVDTKESGLSYDVRNTYKNTYEIYKKDGKECLLFNIQHFEKGTSGVFYEGFKTLKEPYEVTINLVNNSGGYLKETVKSLDFFLKNGMEAVSHEYRDTKEMTFASKDDYFDGHIIIKVNEKTASAAEVMTLSLKSNYPESVKIVGVKTHGKRYVLSRRDYKKSGLDVYFVKGIWSVNNMDVDDISELIEN